MSTRILIHSVEHKIDIGVIQECEEMLDKLRNKATPMIDRFFIHNEWVDELTNLVRIIVLEDNVVVNEYTGMFEVCSPVHAASSISFFTEVFFRNEVIAQ